MSADEDSGQDGAAAYVTSPEPAAPPPDRPSTRSRTARDTLLASLGSPSPSVRGRADDALRSTLHRMPADEGPDAYSPADLEEIARASAAATVSYDRLRDKVTPHRRVALHRELRRLFGTTS
jgi:hypothetical protein